LAVFHKNQTQQAQKVLDSLVAILFLALLPKQEKLFGALFLLVLIILMSAQISLTVLFLHQALRLLAKKVQDFIKLAQVLLVLL
jgi:hypothetical protein